MSPFSARVLAGVLEQRTGQRLSAARNWRLDVALDPLVRARGYSNADDIAAAVAGGRDPRLCDEIVEALLNHETSFFRDPAAFRMLVEEAIPALIGRRQDRHIRVWSAGSSTGQEAYSLAMALDGDHRLNGWTVDIVGTDISATAVEQARSSRYSQFEMQRGLPIRQLMRWFEADGDGWRGTPGLRTKVRFHVLSLLDPPPLPGRFDVVMCRNVLLYFAADVKRLVFERLRQGIADDGYLMLGAGETASGQTGHFVPDEACRGIYRPA